MIVGPHKGLFFVATALMCSASLYGAELSSMSSNPLTRIFTGEPNRLTLPPDFPDAALVSVDQDEGCTPQLSDGGFAGAALHTASSSLAQNCLPDTRPEPDARVVPALAPDPRAKVEPASVGGTLQSH